MTIDDSERYLKLMLSGMEYAVKYWKDKDKEESDIEQTNVEAVKTALDTMRKYQQIEQILKDIPYGGEATVRRIQEVVEDGMTEDEAIENLARITNTSYYYVKQNFEKLKNTSLNYEKLEDLSIKERNDGNDDR